MPDRLRRPLVGVSLKMHLTHVETTRWLSAVAELPIDPDRVDVVVLPSFTAIPAAADILAGSPVQYGAQDCFWQDTGPFTGEISPAVLRELGCRYVEVGHAERRALFGEDNEIVAHKATAATAHGLTPIICVGETTQRHAQRALSDCIDQLTPVLAALRVTDRISQEVVVAYEPVWAIGSTQPAATEHIQHVVAGLKGRLGSYAGASRVIYGGSAGPGLFRQIRGIDGLFLGRSALDVRRFAATLAEVASTVVSQS